MGCAGFTNFEMRIILFIGHIKLTIFTILRSHNTVGSMSRKVFVFQFYRAVFALLIQMEFFFMFFHKVFVKHFPTCRTFDNVPFTIAEMGA